MSPVSMQPNMSALADAFPSPPGGMTQPAKAGVLPPSGKAEASAPSGNAKRSSGMSFTVARGHAARAAKFATTQTAKVGKTAVRAFEARIGTPACRTARSIRAATAELKIAVKSMLIRAEASLSPKLQAALSRLRQAAQALEKKAGGNTRHVVERSVAQHCAGLSQNALKTLHDTLKKQVQSAGGSSHGGKVPAQLQGLNQNDLSRVALPIIEKALAMRQFGPCLTSLSNMIKANHDKPAIGALDAQLAKLCETTLANLGLTVMHGRDKLEAGLISQLDGKDHSLAQLRPLLNSKLFQSEGCSTETGLLLSALTTAVEKTTDKRLEDCKKQWEKIAEPPSDLAPNEVPGTDQVGRLQDATSLAFRDLNRLGLFNPGAGGAAVDATALVSEKMAPLLGKYSEFEKFERQEVINEHANRLASFANTSEQTWNRDQGPGTFFNDWKTREIQQELYARDRGSFL
ncbi:hypothetical protein ACMZ4X_03441 [Achromobacter marplatensis]